MSIAHPHPPVRPPEPRPTDGIAPGTHRRPWRRLRLALIVGWRAAELDRHLAVGLSPWRNDELALRALRITRWRSRSRLASGLSRAVRAAQEVTGLSAAVRPHPGEVLDAHAELLVIEQRLRSPEPPAAGGVAIVHMLLSDPTSSLYRPAAPGALASRLRAAAAAMEPRDRAGGMT
ncbi:MAG TPA: hypothetical protein VJ741_08195 [Solirubrobacteraceae bacterium]|nr:hypothetical protein [Solirubrobacteraceae bacterium]